MRTQFPYYDEHFRKLYMAHLNTSIQMSQYDDILYSQINHN